MDTIDKHPPDGGRLVMFVCTIGMAYTIHYMEYGGVRILESCKVLWKFSLNLKSFSKVTTIENGCYERLHCIWNLQLAMVLYV